ncbi:hypothetical protein B0J13DRAFT_572733 [Dactylonectria estremocensis]|uniref:Uncharacterized protein n=1 Tax=Dactylonectria estremocensis TaxID=1079267 RepID=A0A9P9D949_9HYPO|nr:hypothetical protein B0J13DRAFT_572733 [Dactylonectria estremocensis]
MDPAIFTVVIVIHTFTSDYTHKHLPPATDLPLRLIYLAISVLGLTLYWRSHRHARRDAVAAGYGTMSSGDTRTYKQWRAETNDAANDAANIASANARQGCNPSFTMRPLLLFKLL